MMKDIMVELIEKFKRNSKLSMDDTGTFEKELVLELSKGEYSDDLETILCEGPVDISMKVLARYLSHIENDAANVFVNKFITSKRIEENKGGTSGMRIVFLYCFLWTAYDEQNKIIENVFFAMIRFSYRNGKDETNKKTVELIRKNVLPFFANNKILNLGFVNQEKIWIKLRNLFIEAAVEGDLVNLEIVQKVYHWLKSANKDMGKVTEDYLMECVIKRNMSNKEAILPDKSAENKEIVEPTQSFSVKAAEQSQRKESIISGDEKRTEKQKSSTEKIIETMVSVVIACSKEINLIKSELSLMKQKADDFQLQINKSLNRQAQQEEAIHSLASDNLNLQKQNAEFTAKIAELEQLVEKQKREIDDRKQFTDTVARNREKQSEEQLNKIASKLRVEYRDFCDAKNIDMTIDLGENMREQLGAVFSILEKSGIKLN